MAVVKQLWWLCHLGREQPSLSVYRQKIGLCIPSGAGKTKTELTVTLVPFVSVASSQHEMKMR